MKPILVLQHVPHETLGTLEGHFRGAGLAWEYVHLFEHVPDRLDLDAAAGLVVMGGPMNVDEVDRFPFLGPEIGWIQAALGTGIPLLGICLGSQLLAKALGARVFANGVKEIGFYEIELTPEAGRDPLFSGCPTRQTVFQWHGDTFDLPHGASLLATSERCRHQAFRYGEAAWGLQFHVEVDAEMVETWLDEPDNRREMAALDYIDPMKIRTEAPRGLQQMNDLARQVLPRFAAACRLGSG